MNFKLTPYLFALIVMFSACNSGTEEEETSDDESSEESSEDDSTNDMDPELVKLMVGDWEAAYLHITIASEDTSVVMHVDAPDFPETLGIQNNYTSYYDDGTYLSRYVSTNGVVMMEKGGSWEITPDSLLITEDEGTVYRYTYEFRGDTATWEALVDWDGDGDMDDHMIGASIPSDWEGE